MPQLRNHYSIGVRFESHAYAVVSDPNIAPEDVLAGLEDFCARIRRDLARRDAPDPVIRDQAVCEAEERE
jgi:hypothetical protein